MTEAHRHYIEKARGLVSADARFAGLAVSGSGSEEGRTDEWSDLDLVLVSYPEHQAALLGEAKAFAAALGDLLAGFTGEHVGEPRVLICLYDNPMLHIDLKFIPLADFEQRVDDPKVICERDGALSEILARTRGSYPNPDLQWIEDRFWVWVHYGAQRLGRGELLELADHLGFLRNGVLSSLLAMQHGLPARRMRRAEQDLPPEAVARLGGTLAVYERKALIDSFYALIALYRDLRETAAKPELMRHARAEARSLAYLDEVVARCG